MPSIEYAASMIFRTISIHLLIWAGGMIVAHLVFAADSESGIT